MTGCSNSQNAPTNARITKSFLFIDWSKIHCINVSVIYATASSCVKRSVQNWIQFFFKIHRFIYSCHNKYSPTNHCEKSSIETKIWIWQTTRRMKQCNFSMRAFGGIKLVCSSFCSRRSEKISTSVGKMAGPQSTMPVAQGKKTSLKFLLCGTRVDIVHDSFP